MVWRFISSVFVASTLVLALLGCGKHAVRPSEKEFLADRIILMRPGAIVRDVEVDLPRPRSIEELQEDPAYHDLYRKRGQEMKGINR